MTKYYCKCGGEINPKDGLCIKCGKLYPQFKSIRDSKEVKALDKWLEESAKQMKVSKMAFIELCKKSGSLEPAMIDLLINIAKHPEVVKK